LILRECIRHEALAKIILYSNKFYQFFDYVEMSTFDIASDAFASFKEILTKHKPMVADFLELNYDEVSTHLLFLCSYTLFSTDWPLSVLN
jgi:calcium binding protein 39